MWFAFACEAESDRHYFRFTEEEAVRQIGSVTYLRL